MSSWNLADLAMNGREIRNENRLKQQTYFIKLKHIMHDPKTSICSETEA